MTDDDDDWSALLAGRARPQADAGTRSEASHLRDALLAYRQTAPQGDMPTPERRIERLLQRGREAGLLTPKDAPKGGVRLKPESSRWPAWLRPQRLVMAMTLLLSAGLAYFQVEFGTPDEQAQQRGGGASQTVRAARPAEARAKLLANLRAAGFEVLPFERLGRLGLDVELPNELSEAQRRVLIAQGLSVPEGPALSIEIVGDTESRP